MDKYYDAVIFFKKLNNGKIYGILPYRCSRNPVSGVRNRVSQESHNPAKLVWRTTRAKQSNLHAVKRNTRE
ncbi:MAG: hypothetical protein DSM106950_26870 [Stigonema ocellatum SAG 48.90 = DSM 106950]|nr:hypothetical protein [Stigonema ocellatum SAG 48.90 = DSM 106950]